MILIFRHFLPGCWLSFSRVIRSKRGLTLISIPLACLIFCIICSTCLVELLLTLHIKNEKPFKKCPCYESKFKALILDRSRYAVTATHVTLLCAFIILQATNFASNLIPLTSCHCQRAHINMHLLTSAAGLQ